jgi:hypothetical protein
MFITIWAIWPMRNDNIGTRLVSTDEPREKSMPTLSLPKRRLNICDTGCENANNVSIWNYDMLDTVEATGEVKVTSSC